MGLFDDQQYDSGFESPKKPPNFRSSVRTARWIVDAFLVIVTGLALMSFIALALHIRVNDAQKKAKAAEKQQVVIEKKEPKISEDCWK